MDIEKGVPVPHKRHRRWASIIDKMDIGDSVVVSSGIEREALRLALRYAGYEATTRHESPGRYRVWKLRKDGVDQ